RPTRQRELLRNSRDQKPSPTRCGEPRTATVPAPPGWENNAAPNPQSLAVPRPGAGLP
ncbi:hypothetical protein P7K49_001159, partial [Saguinus oedipus]